VDDDIVIAFHSNDVLETIIEKIELNTIIVTIVTSGLQPTQRLAKVRAKSEVQESHFILPGV
jgi:hypothetical protein